MSKIAARTEVATARYAGFLKTLHESRRYGFIHAMLPGELRREKFFVYCDSITPKDAIAVGVAVEFEISPVKNGPHRRAVDVVIVG